MVTPSKPPPPTNNFCLYPPPVLRCFWKYPLMTYHPPPLPYFTHPSLLPSSPSTTPSPLKNLIIHLSQWLGQKTKDSIAVWGSSSSVCKTYRSTKEILRELKVPWVPNGISLQFFIVLDSYGIMYFNTLIFLQLFLIIFLSLYCK